MSCKSQLDTILSKITNSKDPSSLHSNKDADKNHLLGDIDLCLICLDLSEPHEALQQLKKWVSVLSNHIQWNCVTDSLEILAQSVRSKWNLDFSDNRDEANYVLSENIGIPILVVGTKTDKFEDLERNEDY